MIATQDHNRNTPTKPGASLAKARPKVRLPTPDSLADIALIDAITCAAAGGMGASWWHDRVKSGDAPQPVIRQPRCTRWRLADVRAFWIARAEQSAGKDQTGELLTARATKASRAAVAARASKRAALVNVSSAGA